MHFPSHLITTALAVLPVAVLAGGPGQPPNYPQDLADGPDKLTLCTPCEKITAIMLKCQRSDNNSVRKCACLPNSEPDAWYGWIHNCRACASNSGNEFFSGYAQTLSQLFVSCTNAGGSVTADGTQICAGNAYFESCTALRDNSTASWATYENYRDKSQPKTNASFVLNLVDNYKPVEVKVSSTSVSVPTGSGSAAAPTGSGGAAAGSGNQAGTETSGSSTSAQTESPESSAAEGLGVHRAAGSIMGAVVAVAFGAMML